MRKISISLFSVQGGEKLKLILTTKKEKNNLREITDLINLIFFDYDVIVENKKPPEKKKETKKIVQKKERKFIEKDLENQKKEREWLEDVYYSQNRDREEISKLVNYYSRNRYY